MPEWKPEIVRRLALLKVFPTREAEITDELAQHLEARYQELVATGQSEDAASAPPSTNGRATSSSPAISVLSRGICVANRCRGYSSRHSVRRRLAVFQLPLRALEIIGRPRTNLRLGTRGC
jgi:hypothetical protein